MSDNKPQIPRNDEGKNSYYLVVVPYINRASNQLRFKSSTGNLEILNEKFALWSPNLLKYHDPTQRTRTVTDLKDSLEVDIDTILDAIYSDIPASVFTADDKAIFFIHERKVASAAVVSPIAPGLALETIGHLWAKVRFNNTATPNSKEAPTGNFVFFETYIGLAGIAHADIVFANGNVSSTATYTFRFTEGQVGQTCYVHGFYQTKKGDRSPASVIISFVIV
jgi:hypothetical protein